MGWWTKLRNIERDPRVALSSDAPRDRDAFMNPYAVLRAYATIEPTEQAWDLLNRLTRCTARPTPSSQRRADRAISSGTRSSASVASALGPPAVGTSTGVQAAFPPAGPRESRRCGREIR